VPDARLIVLTGPSHSGKSSLAASLVETLAPPVAVVAIDEIVATLRLVSPERWADQWRLGLPIAYDVAEATVDVLLRRGITVLLESTFTFVPVDDQPMQCHAARLEAMIEVARRLEVCAHVIHLMAAPEELLRRRATTGRLNDAVVEGTWTLHSQSVPRAGDALIEIDTTTCDVASVARSVAALLSRGSSASDVVSDDDRIGGSDHVQLRR
jgi:chloramphenicol 3-O-phosphotransferase